MKNEHNALINKKVLTKPLSCYLLDPIVGLSCERAITAL